MLRNKVKILLMSLLPHIALQNLWNATLVILVEKNLDGGDEDNVDDNDDDKKQTFNLFQVKQTVFHYYTHCRAIKH